MTDEEIERFKARERRERYVASDKGCAVRRRYLREVRRGYELLAAQGVPWAARTQRSCRDAYQLHQGYLEEIEQGRLLLGKVAASAEDAALALRGHLERERGELAAQGWTEVSPANWAWTATG
jgi:hypothetical protein